MYLKEFENILKSECANCTISFKNNRRKNLHCSTSSTSLQFENEDLIFSPSQDITNFQALSCIYRVSPDLLERSIKKHLKVVFENQNGSPTPESQTGKEDKENSTCDPLNAVNLTLCQKCSKALTELYSVHYKFEKLSKENSIITKGVGYLQEKLELDHQIKLENDDDTGLPISNGDCNRVDNWDEQLTEIHEEEPNQDHSDSVKDEPLDSDYEFVEPNNDEDDCQNEEEIEQHIHTESADHGINVRTSKIRANKRLAAFASVSDEESVVNEKAEDSKVTFSSVSSEDSDNSDIDWSTSNENSSAKKKKKLTQTHNKFVRRTKESSKEWERNLEFGEPLSLNQVADDKNKSNPASERPLKFDGNSLRCVECKVYFPDLNKFLIHHRIYHNLVWKDYSALENWWKLCAKHNYNCAICDEFFISKIDLDMHFLSHDPAAGSNYECNDPIKGPPFLCPKCENSSHLFENWTQLQEHGRLIHKIAFLNQVLKTEENSGRYLNSFFCKECSVPFTLGKAWKKHMLTLHPDSIICDKCNESFSDEASLQLHIAGHDSQDKEIIKKDLRRFSCKDCDKTFRSIKTLWMHRFFHIAEGKESDSNPDLQILKNFEEFVAAMHEDVIPDATIYKSSSLVSADVSNAVDIFCCAKCGKGFKSFYSKKVHQLTHFIKDLDSLEEKTVSGSEFICPKCGIDFQRNMVLREHCLSAHSILISTKAYSGDKFLQELKMEKNDCIKLFGNLGPARSLDEENSFSTNTNTEYEVDPLSNNTNSNAIREDLKLKCVRCDKVFKSLHSKSIHEQAQSINFSTLTKETLSGPEFKCTKCGIEFEKIRMLRRHCLKEHNLIISQKSSQGDEFLEILLKEKKHCENKYKASANAKAEITKTNKSSAIGDDKIKQSSNACKICGKMCPSYRQKKIHETLHTLDLSKVEIEHIKGTNFVCPRCGQGFAKNYLLREHCLKSHNVIASTKSCPGEKFLQQLRQEQQSIPANHLSISQCSSGSAEPDSNVDNYILPDENPEETNNDTPDPDVKTELEIVEEQESLHFQIPMAVEAEPATSQVSSLETDSFICNICSRHFSTQFNRSVHVLSHFEWEEMETLFVKGFPFVCPTCGHKHRTMMLLREHCVTQHGFNVSNEKECKSLLRRRRKPGQQLQQFIVPKFRKILPKPSQSNNESITDGQFFNDDRSHSSSFPKTSKSTAESSLVCEVCERVCSTSNNKYTHVVTHFEWETMEIKTIFGPPYNCTNCKNQYSTFVSARAHCVSVHGFNVDTKLPKKFRKLRKRYLNLPHGHPNKNFQNVTKESEAEKEMESQNNIPEKLDVNLLTNESDSLTCSICSRTLADQNSKSRHVLTHFKWETMEVKTIIFGPPYKCPSCEKEYSSFAFAREHCVSVHGFNVTNTLLPKVFNNMRKKHLNLPHANTLKKKVKAGVSTEEKESESTKKTEENNVSNQLTDARESLACPICSKMFASQENKGTHVITHFEWETMQVKILRGPPYICTSCGENHSTLSSIRAHCVSTHSFNVSNKSSFKFSRARKNPTKTKKDKIRKSASTTSTVNAASASEPQNEETFVCDVCGKVFQNKTALQGHKYCHRQERPFVCEKCGTAFKRANDFRRHKRVHYEKENGIRPQCDICGRTYISTFGLAKHKTNVHPLRKPIPPCTICNKTFATRSYALKHIRKHRQQQPATVDSNSPAAENITPT